MLVALLAACTSSIDGTPETVTSSAGSTAAGPSTSPAVTCPGPTTAAIVICLRASLTRFWTKTLGRRVVDTVVADPSLAQVPRTCRSAIAVGTAFTCPANSTVYLTAPFVRRLRSAAPIADAPYRFAATMAHEMGHVVQFAVHDRLVEKTTTAAESREVEQQADCLSGVWAASVGIADATFVQAAATVFQIVDSRREERSHGTPTVRLAAIARGQAGRSLAACHLTVR